ncbi:MAG TPA: alpha-amylase family glycosyl hydrolase [Woeseiaceae bacterium]|nr:alpha-amylase family glycosyl hydrolase [Woeseiaceae bacterium]
MEQRIADIDFAALTSGRMFFPSPAAWEDEVLYFLMLDRFSDGREDGYRDNDGATVTTGTTPPFQASDRGSATGTLTERDRWVQAGGRFVGGTLRGLESKIGYLERLGITAIWISPVFRQVPAQETYHGYGIQNFLDVDPRFGTRDHLVSLIRTAHAHGIRVILDIILNHAGDVFEYQAAHLRCDVFDRDGNFLRKEACWQADGTIYPAAGYRDGAGNPTLPFGPVSPTHFPDGAIWPSELQPAQTFTRKGKIRNWDHNPEFREGDFESLKDIHQGAGPVDDYRASDAFIALCRVFQFWIAFADLDGLRVDTVKHMDDGASRLFTSIIHEFAQTLGKENFYLIGEITGGRQRAFTTLEITGMNAALGIDDVQDKIEYLIKGFRNPSEYFDLFRNSELVRKEWHVWFRNRVVTTFDDHDQIRKGEHKSRFAHDEGPGQRNPERSLAALAFLVTTMGIPCIYYGTEQQFDGHGQNDRFIREAMFGGEFGAFESRDRHFFNESGAVYRELQKILRLRREHLVIRRGRQFLRQVSGDGQHFGLPVMIGGAIRSVVPWSRIFSDREVLLAVNTDADRPRTAGITVDDGLHAAGDRLTCLYSTDGAQTGRTVEVEPRNGKAVQLTVPGPGFVAFA